MTCVICKLGETAPGLMRVVLQRGETTVVIKDVPTEICDNCGEYYLCVTAHNANAGEITRYQELRSTRS